VASMASNRVLVLDMERLMDVVHQTPEDELAYRLDLLDEFLVATIPVGP